MQTLPSALLLTLLLAHFAAAPPSLAAPLETHIKWHGHATFEITLPSGKVLWVDPWFGNPANPDKQGLEHAAKADFIFITHGHSDHVGEAVVLAKKTGAKVVAPHELGGAMIKLLGLPAAQAGMDTLANAGGVLDLIPGELKVAFTPAVHASGLDVPGSEGGPAYGGSPVGYVFLIQNGPTVYDTGDTAFFRDMEVIGEQYHPEIALINIGGHFGMEPDMAARAAAAVRAKLVIPHHFKTFPILTQDAAPFFKLLDSRRIAHRELKPGEELVFSGKNLKAK
jgi:L-ascorbate metabolism protein UlaG (beta-lactamase superfamily)